MRRAALFAGLGMFEHAVGRVFGGHCAWFAESAGADAERAEGMAGDGGTYASIAATMGRTPREVGTLLREARRSAWCRSMLSHRHPGAASLGDVCSITSPPEVDLIECGFPCTNISAAGDGTGLEGEHSGLWRRVPRIIGACRPRVVLIENSGTLISRGLVDVLRDLHELGYAAAWQVIGAIGVGAPHVRERT